MCGMCWVGLDWGACDGSSYVCTCHRRPWNQPVLTDHALLSRPSPRQNLEKAEAETPAVSASPENAVRANHDDEAGASCLFIFYFIF